MVHLARRLRSVRTWSVLGILAPLGMLVLSGVMLIDLRRDAWEKAEQTTNNLLQVIERDVDRNIEIIDLSLRAVVDNLKVAGVRELSPELRQLVLFDRAASARDMGVMLLLDENGDTVADAHAVPPRRLNNADRDYFKAHKADPHLGLVISRPVTSRLLGTPVIVLSRRINKPDGSFGGVVLGSLKLSYFSGLFDRLGLGQDGAINLTLIDGTRLVRYPAREGVVGTSVAGTQTFQHFLRERRGSFRGASMRNAGERQFAFTRVADWPLMLDVSLSTREIEAEWREKALVIGLAVLALCGLAVLLSLLFERELRRRAAIQAELARLSATDALTGLPNRRRFETAFAQALAGARRASGPVALLIVDADHFKRYNDRYGHAVGDTVLKGLARCLAESVHRPGDLVARLGGEEFAVLLPETDRAGALRIADKVHATVADLAVTSAGIGAGSVTVSIGLAIGSGAQDEDALYRAADAALYEAKAGGRNQTRCAPAEETRPAASGLRLVGR